MSTLDPPRDFFDLVGNMRAMRRLKSDPVPLDLLRKVLDAGTKAPSGMPEAVPEGKATLRYEFEVTIPPQIREGKGAGGNAQLYINDKLVGDSEFPMTTPIIFGLEGMSCGYDFGDGVTEEYKAPFRFTGKISRVTVDVSGDLIQDDEAEVRRIMAKQ